MNKNPSRCVTKFILVLQEVVTQLYNVVLRRSMLFALNDYCSSNSIGQKHIESTGISEYSFPYFLTWMRQKSVFEPMRISSYVFRECSLVVKSCH